MYRNQQNFPSKQPNSLAFLGVEGQIEGLEELALAEIGIAQEQLIASVKLKDEDRVRAKVLQKFVTLAFKNYVAISRSIGRIKLREKYSLKIVTPDPLGRLHVQHYRTAAMVQHSALKDFCTAKFMVQMLTLHPQVVDGKEQLVQGHNLLICSSDAQVVLGEEPDCQCRFARQQGFMS